MLDQIIKNALQEYFKKLTKPVVFLLSAAAHEKKNELRAMLDEMTGLSSLITVQEESRPHLRSGVSFEVLSKGKPTGMVFSGIPGGHEFNSLIFSCLQAGGLPSKLDEAIRQRLTGISAELKFETIVSLSCHNCPEVVQALNEIALLNPHISHEMIDGGVFPEISEERDVMGVPAVFLNGKPFINGKIDQFAIINKLMEQVPSSASQTTSGGGETKTYDVVLSVATTEIMAGKNGVEKLVYQDRVSGKEKSIPAAGVFIQIGLIPHSAPFKELVETTFYGEIVVDQKCRTDLAGVFACGDVTTVPYKQIVIALGEGSKAGLSVLSIS